MNEIEFTYKMNEIQTWYKKYIKLANSPEQKLGVLGIAADCKNALIAQYERENNESNSSLE